MSVDRFRKTGALKESQIAVMGALPVPILASEARIACPWSPRPITAQFTGGPEGASFFSSARSSVAPMVAPKVKAEAAAVWIKSLRFIIDLVLIHSLNEC